MKQIIEAITELNNCKSLDSFLDCWLASYKHKYSSRDCSAGLFEQLQFQSWFCSVLINLTEVKAQECAFVSLLEKSGRHLTKAFQEIEDTVKTIQLCNKHTNGSVTLVIKQVYAENNRTNLLKSLFQSFSYTQALPWVSFLAVVLIIFTLGSR